MATSSGFSAVRAKTFLRFFVPVLATLTVQCTEDAPLELAPLIELSSSSVTFNGQVAGPDPAAQTVTITNSGNGTLDQIAANVTYTDGQPTGWLSASLSGSAAPATLTLAAAAATLTEGTYTASVGISSATADNSPQSVSVSFTVQPTGGGGDAAIALSSTSVSFSGLQGGTSPAPQALEVTNSGQAVLDGLAAAVTYTAGQPTAWLTAELSTNTAPSTLTLTPTTGTLAAGSYTATVNVTSAAAGNSPQTVSVTFTVAPPESGPVIGLSPTSRTFTAPQGGAAPAAQTIAISNGGGGTLSGLAAAVSYSTGQPTGWLSASLSSTRAPSTLRLTVTPGTLTAATYNATVAVSSTGASNSPQTVTVTFTVTPPPTSPLIRLSSLNASFDATQGGANPPAQSIRVTNDGSGTLGGLAVSVGYTGNQPTGWLSATLSTTTAPSTLTLSPTTGSLAAGTYTGRVAVTSGSASNSPQTIQVTFVVGSPGNLPPSAPSGLTASTVSSTQIDLAWTDNSSNEDGFKVERCSGGSCTNFTQVETLGPNSTSYQSTGLTPGTSYTYRVRASNAAGNSPYSNTASASTQPAGPTPPAAPSNLTATAVSSSQINLTWRDNASDEDEFRVEQCVGSAGCTDFVQIGTVPANNTGVQITSLSPGTTYRYQIRASNETGNSAYSNPASATTHRATAPPELRIVNRLDRSLLLDEVVQVKFAATEAGTFTRSDQLSPDNQCWDLPGDGIPSGSSRTFPVPNGATNYWVFIGIGTWETDISSGACPSFQPWFKRTFFFLAPTGALRWVWRTVRVSNHTGVFEWTITGSNYGSLFINPAGNAPIQFFVTDRDPIP